jgi:hypothetical protein
MARATRYLSTICKNKKAAQLAAYKAIRLSTDSLRLTTINITDASAADTLLLQRGTAQFRFLKRLSGPVRYKGMPPQLSRMAIEIFINIVFSTLFQLNNIFDITFSSYDLLRLYSHPKKSDQHIHYHPPTPAANPSFPRPHPVTPATPTNTNPRPRPLGEPGAGVPGFSQASTP